MARPPRADPVIILVVLVLAMVPAAASSIGAATPSVSAADADHAIQPGVLIVTPYTRCTGGFILGDNAGTMYLVTAGHCFGDTCETQNGARVEIGALGPAGTKVLCYARGLGSDMALVRIDAAHTGRIDPGIMVWGGPTTDSGTVAGVVRHYGHGVLYDASEETRARSGLGLQADETSFRMAGLVVNGDSGSPVRHDAGAAVGIITHANGNALGLAAHSAPYAYGTTVARVLALSADAGHDLALMTAPLA